MQTRTKRVSEETIKLTIAKVRQAIVDHGLSIGQACRRVSVAYDWFMRYATVDDTTELRGLWLRNKHKCPRKPNVRHKDVVIKEPKMAPMPKPVVIKTGPSEEAIRTKDREDIQETLRKLDVPLAYEKVVDETPPQDPFGFPRVIYRMHKNFIGTWNCVKLSFFIRVEADVYFVVGYQYELSEFPGVFRADANLFDYNTDVNVALANLRRVIDEKVGPVLKDKLLGLIQYGLEHVAPYDPRTIVAKTKIGAPDGDYTARVSGDLGRIDANGKLYEFAIPENLPAGELPCKVGMIKDPNMKIKIKGLSLFAIDGLWWFRIFGFGVRWKNIKKFGLVFSERQFKRGLRVWNWHFIFLKP